MNKILFISDVFLHGGFESRLHEQLDFYHRNNIETFLICESLQKSNLTKNFAKIHSGIKLLPQENHLFTKDIINSSKQIANFCHKNNIDAIECQPFWCLIPATIAAQKCHIPISYTLHGIASGNFIEPLYYEAGLAFYECLILGLDQIIAVSERLANQYNYISDDIFISPNGIKLNYHQNSFEKTGNFAIASRIDNPKTKVIIDFLPKLTKLKYTKKVDIYGDGEKLQELQKFIDNHGLSDKVKIIGWVPNLPTRLHEQNYNCVFGVGRIVTDTISANLPVGILGYKGFAGLLNKNNFQNFAKTNFLTYQSFPDTLLQKELTSLYKNPSAYLFTKTDLSDFDADRNWELHIKKIQNLKYKNKPAIESMANTLEQSSNKDLLFDTSLLQKFHTILSTYGQDNLIYSSYLTHLATLYENALTDSIKTKKQLVQIKNSRSWKLTSPLRKLNHLLSKKHN